MAFEITNQPWGNFCVVVKTDGTSEVKELPSRDNVFDAAKDFIGCKWIDHVSVQSITPKVMIEFLVNDEGYIDWGSDPAKVNQIATYIYNRGYKPGHYILGDIVMCVEVHFDDGGEFWGMSKELAEIIAKANNEEVLPKAREIVPIPTNVPEPVVTISSFESTDDLIRAMSGDSSVKPTEVKTILGGRHGEKEAEDNQQGG